MLVSHHVLERLFVPLTAGYHGVLGFEVKHVEDGNDLRAVRGYGRDARACWAAIGKIHV